MDNQENGGRDVREVGEHVRGEEADGVDGPRGDGDDGDLEAPEQRRPLAPARPQRAQRLEPLGAGEGRGGRARGFGTTRAETVLLRACDLLMNDNPLGS